MTAHRSIAQIVEIRDALELITEERNHFSRLIVCKVVVDQ
jgi:hypothetical protein